MDLFGRFDYTSLRFWPPKASPIGTELDLLLTMAEDALHVAIAIVSRCEMIVSWNFRHLVNRRRRALINESNVLMDYPAIEILAPPEV